MKNRAAKTRTLDNPYAHWHDLLTGTEYWLLKSWQANNSKDYARWFVAAKSDATFGSVDMGDEYCVNLQRSLNHAIGLEFDTSIWPDLITFTDWYLGW